jgi:DNA-binding LacI/PurR family transcriptional regulator
VGVCLKAGVRVPRDLALVGYDNTAIAHWLDLTSVEQHFDRVGALAMQVLLDEIEGRRDEPVHLEVDSELVIRGSTGQ